MGSEVDLSIHIDSILEAGQPNHESVWLGWPTCLAQLQLVFSSVFLIDLVYRTFVWLACKHLIALLDVRGYTLEYGI